MENQSIQKIERDKIIVVCCADDSYVMPLAVVIKSILSNLKNNRSILFFIIDGGIENSNKTKLHKAFNLNNCEIKWLQQPEGILDNMKVSGHIKISAYLRLLIPELLPQHLYKAIYLDSDLVVNSDLSLLWDIEIEDNYVLAVQDLGIPYVSSKDGLINYKELGLSPNCKYLNSGVLVINLDKWRYHNTGQKIIEYIEHNKDYIRWHDQDGINAVIADQWGELEPMWNQVPNFHKYVWQDSPFSEEDFNNALYKPFIIHFASSSKPWNSNVKHPGNNLFFHYLDMTPWAGWRFTIWRKAWRKILKYLDNLNIHKSFLPQTYKLQINNNCKK